MSAVRGAIAQAMHLLKATAPGDDPTADELQVGLEAAQAIVLELHQARGPMLNIDVAADITPGENQRIRVESGASVTVSLPSSVSIFGSYDPFDYGFGPSAAWDPQVGSSAPADGVYWRAPRDGTRIEVVQGGVQSLWFYRADTDTWAPAAGMTIDTELPLNAGHQGDFAAVLAERLADVLANLAQPTPAQRTRIANARTALFGRPGVRREPVRAQYF
jgi:hypothetical protein